MTIDELLNQGVEFLALEQYDRAVRYFDKVINLEQTNELAYFLKGNALSKQKKYKEAMEAYDYAIKYSPGYKEAYVGKGAMLLYIGSYEEAIKQFEHALRIDPSYKDALLLKEKAKNLMEG